MLRAILLLLSCVVATEVAADDVLDRGNGPEPTTLDAHRAPDLAAQNVLRDLYEGLVVEAADGTIVPGMAERWTLSDDARRWTFHLRANLRWSNGEPLHADQIAASLRRALDPDTTAPMAPLLATIAGAEAVLRGEQAVDTLGVHARDARTLVIELAQPTALLERLVLPLAYPVHLPSLKAHGAQHTRPGKLVTNGAYRLAAWMPQSRIELERNPHFHAAASVAIARVHFHVSEDANTELNRYAAGDLDLTETVPPARLDRLRARFESQLRISPYLGVFYYGFNLRRAPFAGRDGLRRALALAIDRDVLTRYVTALGERPAYSLIPPALLGTAAKPPAMALLTAGERVAEARRLYAASGYSEAEPLELDLRYNTSTPHRRLALAVAAMWRETLGVRTRLVNEEWKVFVQNRSRGRITEVFRGGWIADVADPLSFLAAFDGDNALNWSGFDDAEYSRLLATARVSANVDARLRLYADAETRVLDAQAILPIYFYSSKHLVRDGVYGFVANPLDRHASRWMRLGTGAE